MAIAKVTAMELRNGDDVMIYLYNAEGTCVRIITLHNSGNQIDVNDNSVSSKMPLVLKHNDGTIHV